MSIPEEFEIWTDVSHWWPGLDYALLSQWLDGFIIKATSGSYSIDPMYREHYDYIGDLASRSPYHWNDPLSNDNQSVALLVGTVDNDEREFIMVDSEQWWADWSKWRAWIRREIPASQVPKLSPARISESAYNICNKLTQMRERVLLYTNMYFVLQYSPQMLDWIGDVDVCYAQYPYGSGYVNCSWDEFISDWLPAQNEPYWASQWPSNLRKFSAWQFTGNKFILPGFNGRTCDLDYIKKSWLNNEPPPEPPHRSFWPMVFKK